MYEEASVTLMFMSPSLLAVSDYARHSKERRIEKGMRCLLLSEIP